ncbi:MAG: mandelate racemase/muconate lactonizing enzyme family protein [Armatimonadota bacterium]
MSFRLPFRTRFSTSRGTCAYREGLILWLRTDSGVVGLGEASPIAEAGAASLQGALAILNDVGAALIGKELADIGASLDEMGQLHPALAAVRCALEVAVWDAIARGRGVSVASLLADDIAPSVAVNTTIGAPTTAAARAAAAEARAAGFRCFKLKVGMARSMDDEHERVAAVRDALGPDIALRLDANGAWGVEQAIRTIRALEKHDLELVEQPVRPGDLDGMRRVRESVNTPIAADEDITSLASAQRVLQAGAAQVLVLKPMVLAGLRPACQIAQLAGAMGASVIVTTTIDAGIATAAALHLAATLPAGGPACGLATGALLAGDLITRPLEVRCGLMEVPDGPGLGVELDERELLQYGSGIEREVP